MHHAYKLGLMLLLACGVASSQSNVCSSVVPFVVRQKSEKPVLIQTRELVVRLGFLPIQPKVLDLPNAGKRRVVFMLDTSASMKETWEITQSLVYALVRSLDKNDELALVGFSAGFTGAVPLTRDRGIVLESVRQASTEGRTALFDAVSAEVQHFELHASDALVLVTDGGDNQSRTREDELHRILVSAGIRVFAVEMYDPRFPTIESLEGHRALSEMVELTGGERLEVNRVELHMFGKPAHLDENTSKQLLTGIANLANSIDSPVWLRIDWPRQLGSGKPQKLEMHVIDAAGNLLKDLQLFYPRRVISCPAPPHAAVPASPN